MEYLEHKPDLRYLMHQLKCGAAESAVYAALGVVNKEVDGVWHMDFRASDDDHSRDGRGGMARLTRTHCAEAWPLPVWNFKVIFLLEN